MRPKVIVVDAHTTARAGLASVLGERLQLEVVAEAGTAADALAQVELLDPALVTVDLRLDGDVSGLELIRRLRAQGPTRALLVVSMHDEETHGERAFLAGANGYVMKRAPLGVLCDAVKRVLMGRRYASDELLQRLRMVPMAAQAPRAATRVLLSKREEEILELIGSGLGTRAIATRLELSVKTVESHRANLKVKLDIETAPQLVRYAVQWLGAR